MTEFRPISLCNVSYKIISKLLCKRLKRVISRLISETQSAFVAKRLITDSILIAQENFHALQTNQRCREDFMAIKTRPEHFTRTRRPEPEPTQKYRFGSGSGSGSMLSTYWVFFFWTRGSRFGSGSYPRPVLVSEVPANNCIY